MTIKQKFLIIAFSFPVLLGIGGYFFTIERSEYDSSVIAEPMVFGGTIPCADCEGIITHLTLYPDGTYLFAETYKRKSEEIFETAGTWIPRIEKDGTYYDFHPEGGGDVRYYFRPDPDSLLMLDKGGKRIESKLDYTLERIRS